MEAIKRWLPHNACELHVNTLKCEEKKMEINAVQNAEVHAHILCTLAD